MKEAHMARVIGCVMAFVLSTPALAGQTTQTQTFVVQGPGGAVGVGTIDASVLPVPGAVPILEPTPGQTPARDNAPPPRTGTSRIRGRVVDVDTGQPLRRAIVRISGAQIRESRSTATDAEGRYEFRDLPAGRYSLTATKSAYVTVNYGQRRLTESGKPIDLGENQVVDKIDFVLPRGGVITGRIVDEYGEPVANASVQTTQDRFVNGERRPMPTGPGATTPDTGEYRLWGLNPGDYYVSVTPRVNGPAMPNDNSDDRAGYAASYYPGTASLADAQRVTIAAGQTASGVDIMLSPTRTSKVTGTAIDSNGKPVSGGMVMAMQRSIVGGMRSNVGGQIRPDGSFTVSGLAPGDYVLRGNVYSPPGVTPETLVANVTVSGDDVAGILLTPLLPGTVTGRIVFDPPVSSLEPAMIRLTASPKNPEAMFMPTQPAPPVVKDDFTFEMKTSPGLMVIRAGVGGPGVTIPPGTGPWLLKSVRHDTTDITDSGLDLASGRVVTGVEIVLTNRMQVVTGQVLDSRGAASSESTVLVFAQNRERWTGLGRYASMTRPDPGGKYSVRGLAPGDYFAVAVDRVDSQRYSGDPDYYEELSRDAVRLTLSEGETRTVDLKLTIRP